MNELFAASGAAQWDVELAAFGAALAASVSHRFRNEMPRAHDVETFVRSLHLQDLALACACRAGHERAWEHFMREVRPALYASARALVRDGSSNDLVDSLFADLYGLTERDGERRSLFVYYHGRARLATWLRSVLAQRHVDAIRATIRTVPLDEERAALEPSQSVDPVDPQLDARVSLAQAAFDAAFAKLDARDRLRVRLYYGKDLTLAQIGRLLAEHEATVSRKLERARRQLRFDVASTLRRDHGLTEEGVRACLFDAAASPALDISAALADDER